LVPALIDELIERGLDLAVPRPFISIGRGEPKETFFTCGVTGSGYAPENERAGLLEARGERAGLPALFTGEIARVGIR
jgi:hypothetical protein